MKKLGLIISALALVLGISQCRKPNVQAYVNITKDITFSVNGNGGQKGDFEQVNDLTAALDYTWRAGDKIYVYSSNEALLEDNKTDFSNGHYCGILNIASGADTRAATFKGTISVPVNAQTLRFVHFGTDVTINGNNTDGFSGSASFATQNGALTGDNSVSSKVIAICDKEYDNNSSEYTVGSLQVQFGVVRFTFAAFTETADITVGELEKNGLAVNANGAVVYTDGTTTTLGDITVENKVKYYTVLMPKGSTKYSFTDGSVTKYKTAKIDAGVFYTKGNTGESVAFGKDVEVLPGEFKIGDEKFVKFTIGNLYYDGTELCLEANQCDNRTVSDKYCRINKVESSTGTPVNNWGLFGWSTKSTNYGLSTSTNNADYLGDFVDWGEAFDGVVRTLSKDEWNYLLYKRENATSKYKIKYLTLNRSSVSGLILIPDDVEFTASDWSKITTYDDLTKYKAVFLPYIKNRGGTDLAGNLTDGHYWTSTPATGLETDIDAWQLFLSNGSLIIQKACIGGFGGRYKGYGVRLVQDVVK